jgi:hypothetical protein
MADFGGQAGCACPLRDPLRLIWRNSCVKSATGRSFWVVSTVNVHHFEEIIGGRAYNIEVMRVSNLWRAQLARSPGVPTAMMPFYGQTPDEAAHKLGRWLELAHRRQPTAVAPAATRYV